MMRTYLIAATVLFSSVGWSQTIDDWKAFYLNHSEHHWEQDGLRKPDLIGSYDLEQVEIEFSVASISLPSNLSYRVTVRPTMDGLERCPWPQPFIDRHVA